MMFSIVALLLLLSSSLIDAYSTDLTGIDFPTFRHLVTSSPSIVFFGSTDCEACQTVIPEWEKVEAYFEDNPDLLVQYVNCEQFEGHGRTICWPSMIERYPHWLFWKPSSPETGEDYNGDANSEGLIAWIEKNLKPACTYSDRDSCTEKQRKYIEKWRQKAPSDVQAQLAKLLKLRGGQMKESVKEWVEQRISALKVVAMEQELDMQQRNEL